MYTNKYVADILHVIELFIIAQSRKLEIIQMSTNSIIYKQNIIYSYSGLRSNENKLTNTCNINLRNNATQKRSDMIEYTVYVTINKKLQK